MKKFITTVPLQPADKLMKSKYEAVDNDRLQYEKETSFPVMALMNGYVSEGEEIQLLAIRFEYSNALQNFKKLEEEVAEFCEGRNCKCNIIVIEIPYSEVVDNHLQTFHKLIQNIEDEDEIFACLTYGTKMIPIVELMTINYAYRAKTNTSIKCIAYGGFDFESRKASIYDVTGLFFMDEIVRKIGELKISDPLKYLSDVLQEDSEEE